VAIDSSEERLTTAHEISYQDTDDESLKMSDQHYKMFAPVLHYMSSGEWSGEDDYECAECGEIFDSEDALREHHQSAHEQ
jgi:hypothetical protein